MDTFFLFNGWFSYDSSCFTVWCQTQVYIVNPPSVGSFFSGVKSLSYITCTCSVLYTIHEQVCPPVCFSAMLSVSYVFLHISSSMTFSCCSASTSLTGLWHVRTRDSVSKRSDKLFGGSESALDIFLHIAFLLRLNLDTFVLDPGWRLILNL